MLTSFFCRNPPYEGTIVFLVETFAEETVGTCTEFNFKTKSSFTMMTIPIS